MQQPENQSKKYSALFTDIDGGKIKIPQFQRDFVWGKAESAALIDSILKGFPIGTFILWKTKERLLHMKNVGNFKLKEPDRGDAVQYILDGQQRITSLYAVRKGARFTRKNNIEIDYKDIVIDLTVDPNEEEVVLTAAPNHGEYISVFDLLNATVEDLVRDHGNHINIVSEYKRKLEGYDFSTVVIDEYPIEIACEVFTRINTGGKALSLFEIMVAKTFDQERDFDLDKRYEQLKSSEDGDEKDLESVDYDTIPNETILQCVAANVCRSIRGKDVLRIKRDDFIDSWDETKNGLFEAVDYLRGHVWIEVSRILPYNVMLIPLTWFFVNKGGVGVSPDENLLLRQWVYWAALTNRFGSAVGAKIDADLNKMQDILDGRQPEYDSRELEIRPKDLRLRGFSVGDAYCKAIVCLLYEQEPRRFNTNGKVRLGNDWLKASTSKNYHHFFPKSFLKRKGYDGWQSNSMMNIVLVDDYLNKRIIGARPPSAYIEKFRKENKEERKFRKTLSSHFIGDPSRWGIADDDYNLFLDKRAKRIAKELNQILNPVLCQRP